MFGFGKRKGVNKKPPIETFEDLKKLQVLDEKAFMEVVPAYAEEGNVICQTFMAQTAMHLLSSTNDPTVASHMEEKYVKYGTMAAESGVAEEQFNLGLFFVKKFDNDKGYIDHEDAENFHTAAYWMRKSANAGFSQALEIVDDVEGMADGRFAEDDRAHLEDDVNKSGRKELDGLTSMATEQLEFDRVVSELAPKNFGDVKQVIQEIGLERAARFYAQLVRLKIPNEMVRWQFILEELDGAAQGNVEAQSFVEKSGVSADEYSGALDRSWPEVDGPEGPQQMLRQLSMQLIHDRNLAVRFTTLIVGRILEDHRLNS